jgi:hypothetical protein
VLLQAVAGAYFVERVKRTGRSPPKVLFPRFQPETQIMLLYLEHIAHLSLQLPDVVWAGSLGSPRRHEEEARGRFSV